MWVGVFVSDLVVVVDVCVCACALHCHMWVRKAAARMLEAGLLSLQVCGLVSLCLILWLLLVCVCVCMRFALPHVGAQGGCTHAGSRALVPTACRLVCVCVRSALHCHMWVRKVAAHMLGARLL